MPVRPDEGFYADKIELTLSRVRMDVAGGRVVPAVAEQVTGVIHLSFADLMAIIRQPDIIADLWSGIEGLAKFDLSLDNRPDGGLVVRGAVQLMGRRIPVSSSIGLRIEDGKLVISAGKLEGLPLIGSFIVQPFDLTLPLRSPAGMTFTGVSTAPGAILLELTGKDFDLRAR